MSEFEPVDSLPEEAVEEKAESSSEDTEYQCDICEELFTKEFMAKIPDAESQEAICTVCKNDLDTEED